MDKAEMVKSALTHDESCLENMRQIVKEYISYRQKPHAEDQERHIYRNRYEEHRQRMRDEALRAFTAFELMEKLCWQEYLSNGR